MPVVLGDEVFAELVAAAREAVGTAAPAVFPWSGRLQAATNIAENNVTDFEDEAKEWANESDNYIRRP